MFFKNKNPSKEKCEIFKTNLDFVISNLKFSLVHHNARVDGTMMKAWEQEKELLEGQLHIIEKFPQNTERIKEIQKNLKNELENVKNMIELSKDPVEFKRLNGMCDMHKQFVRTLESLVPLLKQKCPYD